MQSNILGRTGLRVSRLGFGTSEIGLNLEIKDKKNISDIFNFGLDNGINFIDTASSYGIGEQIIGECISNRRSEFILASKTGHSVLGKDWTYDNIIDSVNKSLRLLKTDYIDIMQLHGTEISSLEKGDVVRALQDLKAEKMFWRVRGKGIHVWSLPQEFFESEESEIPLPQIPEQHDII